MEILYKKVDQNFTVKEKFYNGSYVYERIKNIDTFK